MIYGCCFKCKGEQKLKECIDWLQAFVDGSVDNKLVIDHIDENL